MNDAVDRWQQTAEAYAARYERVDQSQWAGPTPCPDWTVRDLVDHVASTQVRFGGLLGLEVAEGADWPTVWPAMARLLGTEGVLEGSVAVPSLGGELAKEQILDICTNDLLMHTWDLARAIGADETLPPRAVSACYGWLQQMPVELIRSPGRFAPALPAPADADEQTKLLAFAGRRT